MLYVGDEREKSSEFYRASELALVAAAEPRFLTRINARLHAHKLCEMLGMFVIHRAIRGAKVTLFFFLDDCHAG